MAGRHHYVSQFHLRGFTDPHADGLPHPWLWVADCRTGTIKRRSPKNFAWSHDLFQGLGLHADHGILESFLSREVEGPAAPALRKFVAGEGPPQSDMGPQVWRYLAWAAARSLPMKALWQRWSWADASPRRKSEWRTIESLPPGLALMTEICRIARMEHPTTRSTKTPPTTRANDCGGPDLSTDEFREIIDLWAWYFEAWAFRRLKWLWARAPVGQYFIIGDRPVVWGFANETEAPPNALLDADIQIFAPLSRSLALIGHHPVADPPETVFPSDINRIIASAAHQRIAGPTEDLVRELVSLRPYH